MFRGLPEALDDDNYIVPSFYHFSELLNAGHGYWVWGTSAISGLFLLLFGIPAFFIESVSVGLMLSLPAFLYIALTAGFKRLVGRCYSSREWNMERSYMQMPALKRKEYKQYLLAAYESVEAEKLAMKLFNKYAVDVKFKALESVIEDLRAEVDVVEAASHIYETSMKDA